MIILTSGNIIQNSARTLCIDVTPAKQQILMSNICLVYSEIGCVLTNLVGELKLYQYTKLDQEQFILVVCISISVVAMGIKNIVTPEEPFHETPNSQSFQTNFVRIKKNAKARHSSSRS